MVSILSAGRSRRFTIPIVSKCLRAGLAASALAGAALLAHGMPAAAASSWDAAADFSATTNPNGAWSYGWAPTGSLDFRLDPNPERFFGAAVWSPITTPDFNPSVFFNPTDSPLSQGSLQSNVIPPHSLAFHPGPSGEHAIVRWTAPAVGAYEVSATFTGLDRLGPTTTDVEVLVDGSLVWQGEVTGYLATQSYAVSARVLGPGETIDFAVGDGIDGNYLFDTTGISATVSQARDTVPPTTTASFAYPDGSAYVPSTWTPESIVLGLSCQDNPGGSGCARTEYELDGGVWSTYTGPFVIGAEGQHLLAYRSIDNGGNIESAHAAGVWIDRTPPATTVTALPGALNGRTLASGSATVTVSPGGMSFAATCFDSYGVNAALSATDNLSGVRSTAYGSAAMVFGQPLPSPALTSEFGPGGGSVVFTATGAFVLDYASSDNTRNIEATESRWVFVNGSAGFACVTTPIPVSSLPTSGTVTVTSSLLVGTASTSVSFAFAY